VPGGAPPNRKCEDTFASVGEMFIQRHVARLYTHDAESTIRREVSPLRRDRPDHGVTSSTWSKGIVSRNGKGGLIALPGSLVRQAALWSQYPQ